MKRIFKYGFSFSSDSKSTALLPCGAEILHVNMQDKNDPRCFIWALIDDSVKGFDERTFIAIGTGDNITEDMTRMKYLNTMFLYDGQEVYHIFEIV
jgi:hypothetical protein